MLAMKTRNELIEAFTRKLEEQRARIENSAPGEHPGTASIQSQINIAWEIRYSNTNQAADLAKIAFNLSVGLNYPKEIVYSRLMLAVCKFINNENNELLLGEFLDLAACFNEYPAEWGYFVCKIQLANIYELLGEYDNGKEAINELLFQIQANCLRDIESELLLVSGNLFYRNNEIEKAIEQYNKALAIKDELNDLFRYAAILDLLGRANVLKKDLDKAYSFYAEALAIREAILDPAIVNTYIGFASYYKRKNEVEKINEFYLKAFSSLRKKDKFNRMICHYGRGHFYMESKDFHAAVSDFEEALSIAKSNNIRNKIGDIYKSLSVAYEKAGSLDKALSCYKEYFSHKSKFDKEIYKFRDNFDNLFNRNKVLIQNITEAKVIQESLMPPREFIKNLLPDHLLFFRPLHIISGDYFWISAKDEKIVVILADCTGHGVKASLLTMLGIAYLDEILSEMAEIDAGEVLNSLRRKIINILNRYRPDDPLRYGMDMAICILDKLNLKLKVQYVTAKRPILVIRDGEILESNHTNMSVCYDESMKEFKHTELELKHGDVVYLFSDGYPDQFGGEKGGKFMVGKFKSLLLEIHKMPFKEQELLLESKFSDWVSYPEPGTGLSHEQCDDISVFGFRV